MAKKINYAKEAFIVSYNLIFIIGLLLAGIISGLFLPAALVVIAVQIIYMTFVPSARAFRRYVKNLYYELEQEEKKDQLKQYVTNLNSQNKQKFKFIDNLCLDIKKNYTLLEKNNPTSFALLEESIGKLHYLKNSFIRLLVAYQNYTNFLKNRTVNDLRRKISQLKEEKSRVSEHAQKLVEKRLVLQEKRLTRLSKIKTNSEVIQEQLKTIEDMLLFIQEQSLAVANPTEINDQLSSLFIEIESAEEAAQEMNDIMSTDYI